MLGKVCERWLPLRSASITDDFFIFCQDNKGSLASSCVLTLPCDKPAVGHEDGGQSAVFTTLMTKKRRRPETPEGKLLEEPRSASEGRLAVDRRLAPTAAWSQASSVSEVLSPSILNHTEPSWFTTLLCPQTEILVVFIEAFATESFLQLCESNNTQSLNRTKDVLKCVVSEKLVV